MLLVGLGIFLFRAGLDAADRWASVLGAFLNIAGLMVAVYSAVWTRRAAAAARSPAPPAAAARAADVGNTIRSGQFTGPVTQARDVKQVDTRPGPGAAILPMATESGNSDAVSNLIEGGRFHGPVIQGRDIHMLPPADPVNVRPDPGAVR